MAKQVQLVHSIHKARVEEALRSGLKAESDFDDLGVDIRRNAVYCWLETSDDKLSAGGQKPDHVYLQATVDESRCVVADMEFSSLALMYRHGQGGRPKDDRVSALFAESYRLTAVGLSAYAPGMFFTPEVLVQGDIGPECVRLLEDLSS